MSQFIYLVSVFWTYRNDLHLNVLLTVSGNGLMPIWQQDIPSRWTLVFLYVFTWVPQDTVGKCLLTPWLHTISILNTIRKAKKTQSPASLKPPQIKMRADTETMTGTSHNTPHDIHQTYMYIYISHRALCKAPRQGAGIKTCPAPQQRTSPCPTPSDDWDIDVTRSNVLFLQTKKPMLLNGWKFWMIRLTKIYFFVRIHL